MKYAFLLLCLIPGLQGCDHKAAPAQPQPQVLAPPIVDTPPPKPATVSKADLPPPEMGSPTPPAPKPDVQPTPDPPKPKPRKPKKPSAATPAPTPAQDVAKVDTPPAAVAPAAQPAAPTVSAAGQLTGGASGDRNETEQTIDSVEKGVNGITRTLSDSEAKTAAQIREFLKQAREALTTGDADGAHTLAMKAKVLLTELNQ